MPDNLLTLVTAIIGATTGIGGLALGVFNTWRQNQKDKVRLKVEPAHAIPVGGIASSNINFGITVINLSTFPVVITDVGFMLRDKRRATLMPVQAMENPSSLPVKLEPRSSYSKHFRADRRLVDYSAVTHAYAQTQCGTTVLGTNGALTQLLKQGPTIVE